MLPIKTAMYAHASFQQRKILLSCARRALSAEAFLQHSPTLATPPETHFDVLIAGGGLLGISCAYHLVKLLGPKQAKQLRIGLIEKEDSLLSLTSSASTGGFRNFYPASNSMTSLSNLSISELQKLAKGSNNCFEMVQKGYVFLSASKAQSSSYLEQAKKASQNGSGRVKVDQEAGDTPSEDGMDIITDAQRIQRLFPYVSKEAQAMMRVNKAGYLHVEKLGAYLHDQCLQNGVQIIRAKLKSVHRSSDGSIEGVQIKRKPSNQKQTLTTSNLVLALGPFLKGFGQQMGLDFPVMNELHSRVLIKDPLSIIPPSSPFLIWSDDITLPWSPQEENKVQEMSKSNHQIKSILEPIPVPGIAGAHLRPLSPQESNGERSFYGIWTYDNSQLFANPTFPPQDPKLYDTVILRGLSRLVPALSQYFSPEDPLGAKTSLVIKSGYYCKTADNTPLLGPIKQNPGLFVCGGVSGFGVMCSQGAGLVVASQVLSRIDKSFEKCVPGVANQFDPGRYNRHGFDFANIARTANQL